MTESGERQPFLSDVLRGLADSPPRIPCKYLYDERGSKLFEAICRTPEYYVTRADLALHEAHLDEISRIIGPSAHIIEFGSGSGVKTRKLLASLQRPRAYTPIEISASALATSVAALRQAFPDIEIHPLQADYTRDIDGSLLQLQPPPPLRRVVYFPGSTISNFDRDEAVDFLSRMRNIAGNDGAILIGVDLLKSRQVLLKAYDDSQGITAQFNLNLLNRMQRELDARLELDDFGHEARFNEGKARVEMHLVARRPTAIEVGSQRFVFEAGDSIHTENSHKYTLEGFGELAAAAGLVSRRVWTDPEGLFSMHWLERRVND